MVSVNKPQTRNFHPSARLIVILLVSILFIIYMPYLKTSVTLNLGHVIVNHGLKKEYIKTTLLNKFEDIENVSPENPRTLRLIGVALASGGQHDRALEYLLRAQNLDPDDPTTLFWLANVYEDLQDYANTLILMHEIGRDNYFPQIDPNITNEELKQLAQKLLNAPISPRAKHEIGIRVYELDKTISLNLFKQAYENSPDDPLYSLNVAWFYFHNRDYKNAEYFGEKAEDRFSDNLWVNLFFGTYYRAIGDLEMAKYELTQIINTSEDETLLVKSYLEMAKIFIAEEQFHTSREYLILAEHYNEDPLAIFLLNAQVYAGMGQCDLAYEKLIEASVIVDTDQKERSYSFVKDVVEGQCPH